MDPASTGLRRFLSLFVPAVCFVLLLWASWLRWGSLLIDTYRDVTVCQQILRGERLYGDFFYEYGFLYPYLTAGVCRILGTSVLTFTAIGIFLTALMGFLLYRLTRLFEGRVAGVAAVLIFFLAFAFMCAEMRSPFNFCLPYSGANTSCVVTLTGALYFFLRHVLHGRLSDLAGWSAVMLVALCFRTEISLLIWCTFIASAGFMAICRTEKSRCEMGQIWCRVLLLASPVALALSLYVLVFMATGGWSNFYQFVIQTMNIHVTGMLSADTDISWHARYLLVAVKVVVVHGLAAILLYCAPALAVRLREKRSRAWPVAGVVGLAVIGGVFWLAGGFLREMDRVYIGFPILMVLGMVASGVTALTHRDDRKHIALFILCAVSVSLMLRIWIYITPALYGCSLGAPAISAYVVLLLMLGRWAAGITAPGLICRSGPVLLAGFLVFLALRYWDESLCNYRQKNVPVSGEIGTVYAADESYTRGIKDVIRYLSEKTSRNATVAVLPECTSIHAFSARRNPLLYPHMVPHVLQLVGEHNVISDFKRVKPDFVVIVGRPTVEHGSPYFGLTYGRELFIWIQKHYTEVYQSGPRPFVTEEFGALIFERRE